MRYIIIVSRYRDNWKEMGVYLDKKEAEKKISDELKNNNRYGFESQLKVAKIVKRIEKDKSYFILVNHGDGWKVIHWHTDPYNNTHLWSSAKAQKETEELRDSNETFMIAESVDFDVKAKINK